MCLQVKLFPAKIDFQTFENILSCCLNTQELNLQAVVILAPLLPPSLLVRPPPRVYKVKNIGIDRTPFTPQQASPVAAALVATATAISSAGAATLT